MNRGEYTGQRCCSSGPGRIHRGWTYKQASKVSRLYNTTSTWPTATAELAAWGCVVQNVRRKHEWPESQSKNEQTQGIYAHTLASTATFTTKNDVVNLTEQQYEKQWHKISQSKQSWVARYITAPGELCVWPIFFERLMTNIQYCANRLFASKENFMVKMCHTLSLHSSQSTHRHSTSIPVLAG